MWVKSQYGGHLAALGDVCTLGMLSIIYYVTTLADYLRTERLPLLTSVKNITNFDPPSIATIGYHILLSSILYIHYTITLCLTMSIIDDKDAKKRMISHWTIPALLYDHLE